jgi:hypothetical protein
MLVINLLFDSEIIRFHTLSFIGEFSHFPWMCKCKKITETKLMDTPSR